MAAKGDRATGRPALCVAEGKTETSQAQCSWDAWIDIIECSGVVAIRSGSTATEGRDVAETAEVSPPARRPPCLQPPAQKQSTAATGRARVLLFNYRNLFATFFCPAHIYIHCLPHKVHWGLSYCCPYSLVRRLLFR